MFGLASSIYERIITARNRRFDDGSTASHALGARTISIGNITSGGTGKTPMTVKTAELLAARGKRVCVLTRGYGRKNAKSRIVVSDGRDINLNAEITGDEPLEIALRLRGKAIVIADPDRVGAAEWAKKEFGVTTFVLDDGFQHRRARREVDIVCVDALDPFGGGKMLPSGRLREPVSGLARASAIVITRAELAGDLTAIRGEIAATAPDVPIFTASARMKAMREIADFVGAGSKGDYSAIANTKGFAFCGLGNPRAFSEQLRRENFDLAGEKAFRDHHRYSQKDVQTLESEAAGAGAAYLLTTGKDAVKLASLKLSMPCFVVEIDLTIDDESGFLALL